MAKDNSLLTRQCDDWVRRPSQEVYTLRLTKEEMSWIFLLLRSELGMKDPLTMKIQEEFYRDASS